MKINNYLPAFTAVLLSVVAVCLINISMVGCAKVAAPEASPDSTPPTVVTTSPTNGATGVAINTKISATFSKTIDPSTAVAANFTLTSTAGAVTGSISYDAPSKTATFTPAANLGYSLTYTASISAVIKDITGNRMAAAYHWSFTTGNNPDTTPPTVVSVAPANGATRVATTTTVEATFCEAMDPSTINAANFTLDHGVTGIVSYDAVNKSAIFTPSSNLIYSTAYTATITTGVKDLAGNAMAANYSWTFTAKPQPGTLDTSFNGTGMATTDVHSSNYNEANGMAVQTDDKIVLAGSVQLFGNNEFALVRYNSDGTLDTSFHYIGKVHTSVGNGSNGSAYAVAVQPDGHIIAGGTSYSGARMDFQLVRYQPNGALDTTFNSTGMVNTSIGADQAYIRALAVQPDGKIVAAGYAYDGVAKFFIALARYNSNGSLDPTFNSTGIITAEIGSSSSQLCSLAIQSDGKIVVAGNSSNGANVQFTVIRYNSNGTLDTSFNSTGIVTTGNSGHDDYPFALALQTDGKIVVTGYDDDGSIDDIMAVRYNSDGSLDTGFNGTGMLVMPPIGNSSAGDDDNQPVVIQPDGKIVIVAQGYYGSNDKDEVLRLNPDGSLDTTFNGTGSTMVTFYGEHYPIGVGLQSDGRIVVAGWTAYLSSSYDLIMRFNP